MLNQIPDTSRRSFLAGTTRLCAAIAGTALLAACRTGGGGAAAATCDDTAGVDAAMQQARSGLQYVTQAADPAKRCDACMLYTAGAAGGCGTCTALAGPIAPAGSCMAFAPRPA